MKYVWVGLRHIAALIILALLLPAAVSARQSQTGKQRIANLKFNGLVRFTPDQASAVAKIWVGDTAGTDDLKTAGDRLAQSGGFERVSYAYRSDAHGLSVQFDLLETQRFVPCIFENFVWFSDEDLRKSLRSSVPLFGDVVPQNGPTLDEIVAALRALVRPKAPKGDVEKIPQASMAGILQGMSFRVTGVPMPVRDLSFPGASAISQSDLQKAAVEVIGRDYMSTEVADVIRLGVTPLYLRLGYLRATARKVQVHIKDMNQDEVSLAVAVPIEEGQQYFWDKASWTGNISITSSQLDKLLGMHAKDLANAEKIDAGLHEIAKAYGTNGYITTAIQSKQTLDDTSRLAAYDFLVTEGVQYHMGQVHFVGFPDSMVKQLTDRWRLKPGAIYDGNYPGDFVSKIAPPKSAAGKPAQGLTITVQPNPNEATADVTISLK